MIAPPFLVSFSTYEHFLSALPEDLRVLYDAKFKELVSHKLPPVASIRCLATLFGYSPKFVGALYSRTERYYRTFYIPKGKGRRTIHAPRVALKVIQKWFGQHLADALNFDEWVFGFVKGRSAIQAAAVHCGANWIYSVDIKDFFPTIPTRKIVNALTSLGYPDHGAELMGKLCSYYGVLSQGSPASPVLSNLVFKGADGDLANLARRYGLYYTRYADDIVFSGRGKFPAELKHQVKVIVESGGWKLATKKEQFSEKPMRLKVYGLLVHGERPRLPKYYRNKIRAFKHLLEINKVAAEDIVRIKGHLAYAQSVETLD